MTQQITKHYPMQGSRRHETTSFPCVKTFRLTCTGIAADKTTTLHQFEKGSMVLGFQGKVTEVFGATGTLQLGFTGKGMISTAIEMTTLTSVGVFMGPSTTGAALTYVVEAVSDTFDVINVGYSVTAGGAATGALDIHVLYVPPPDGAADSTYKQYYAT